MDYKEYLFGIIISFAVAILIDFILPNGRFENTIKSISNLLIFVMMLLPMINLLNNKLELEIEPNNEVIESIQSRNNSYLEFNIEKLIKSELNIDSKVEIENELSNNNGNIKFVSIFIGNNIINEESVNIHLEDKIKNLVSNYLNINIDMVIVYD